MLDLKNEILTAEEKIRPYICQTPLYFSSPISKLLNANIYLKCENLQYTGSFKARGAFNKLLSLTLSEKQMGIVAASSGNHGAAVAFGLNQLNMSGIIFVPEHASLAKVSNIQNYDVSLKFYGTDCIQTELYASDYAKKHHMIYVSPYNDVHVIAGQGTIALEVMQQVQDVDYILVPVGGGGLISGIAAYTKSVSPQTQIIGCLPENSPVMAKSIKARKIIEMDGLPTLSDATAGGIESRAITLELCDRYVDDYILVSEQEIKDAIITIINTHHLLIEGAAALSVASILKHAARFKGKNVVVILSGANISLTTLKTVLG